LEEESTVPNCVIASALIASSWLFAGSWQTPEEDRQSGTLAGFFCQTPTDVRNIVQRMATSDARELADLLSRMPEGINCSFETDEVTLVGSTFATVGDTAYLIIQFKDSSGSNVYSWKRLDGIPV
jgi:hypothetical protein